MVIIDALFIILAIINEKISFKSLLENIKDIDIIYIELVLFIVISIWMVLCVFTKNLISQKKERIDEITKKWKLNEINEFLEKNKYISLSTFTGLYTSTLAVLYFLFSLEGTLKNLYDKNNYFKTYIFSIILVSIIVITILYNYRLKLIREIFIEKNRQNKNPKKKKYLIIERTKENYKSKQNTYKKYLNKKRRK